MYFIWVTLGLYSSMNTMFTYVYQVVLYRKQSPERITLGVSAYTLQMLWRDCANNNCVWVILFPVFSKRSWIAIGPRLQKLSLVICNSKCANQPAHPRSLISNFVVCFLDESNLHLLREKFQFLASLFSRRDWFKTRFVGTPEDRFSRVVACVACSTALGHILQVQQILILKKIMRRLLIRYINGSHIIWLRSASSNIQVIRYYGSQSQGTAGTLISWLQVPGMTLY